MINQDDKSLFYARHDDVIESPWMGDDFVNICQRIMVENLQKFAC